MQSNLKVLAIDIETGGLYSAQNPLLQIGMYEPSSGMKLSLYVKPREGLILTPEACKVNGYPESHQGKHLLPEQEAITAFVRKVEQVNPDFLLAHNAPFDYQFLREVAARHGLAIKPRCLCTMTTAAVLREVGGLPVKSLSLSALLEELSPEFIRPEQHTGGDDAHACYVVWVQLLERLNTMSNMAAKAAVMPQQPQQQFRPPRRHSGGWGGR